MMLTVLNAEWDVQCIKAFVSNYIQSAEHFHTWSQVIGLVISRIVCCSRSC